VASSIVRTSASANSLFFMNPTPHIIY